MLDLPSGFVADHEVHLPQIERVAVVRLQAIVLIRSVPFLEHVADGGLGYDLVQGPLEHYPVLAVEGLARGGDCGQGDSDDPAEHT